MSDAEKVSKLKIQLNITGDALNAKLLDYLDNAKREILNWMYINKGGVPEDVTEVPAKYEIVQIQAVVTGYNLEGGENEAAHSENGISHTFRYSSMVEYIRSNVFQVV